MFIKNEDAMNSQLAHKIQALKIDQDLCLTKGCSGFDLKHPIAINDIIFRKHQRFIGYAGMPDVPFEINHKVEACDCYTYKEGYTALGLLCFELLFSNRDYIELHMTNEKSDIQQFFIFVDRENHHQFSSFLKYSQKESFQSFEYYPQEVEKFPLSQFPQNKRTIEEKDLSTFSFGWSNHQESYTETAIKKADQLILSCSITGLIILGGLFLDMGLETNEQNEICLENPLYGFGGVSAKSIETRFWLPNSFGFYTDKLEDLKF